uniref:PWWP domain-containing protein n=1 Tax=Timema cristinae TaxID=61476 RepID=A0A7R9D475_TIMCR|nr:unnamed protein product [Timema cristinae]
MDKENCLVIPDTSINENISDLPNDTAGKSSVAPKSRYGRVHKPKIVGDFLSTDKKVAAILGLTSTGSSTQKNNPTLDTQTNSEDNLHVKSKTFSYNVETDSCLPKIHQDIHENTLKEKPKMGPKVETVSETIPATTSELIRDPEDGPRSGSKLNPPLPPCTWAIGDLLWARVGGHPFWPCIVVEDLTLAVFTKVKAFGGSRKLQRYFHVQFYGDNGRRSWVPASGLIPYEGVEAFNKLSEETLSKLKKYERKQATAFIVRPSSRIKWDVSVQESEQAFHLSRTQRIQEFSFKYPQTMSLKQKQISEPFLSEQSNKPLKKPLKRKAEETPSPKKRKYVKKGTPVKNNCVTLERGTLAKKNIVTPEKDTPVKKNNVTPEKDTPVKENIVTPEKDTPVKKNIVTPDKATPLVRKKRLSKVDLEDASVVNKSIIDFDDDFVMNKDSTDDDEDYIPSKSKRKATENVSYSDPSHSKISVKTRVRQQSKNRKFSTLIEDEAFLRYYDSHIDMVLDEHPQWTTEQIDTYMITNWKWVEDSKKAIFHSKVESEAEARRFGNSSEDNAEKPHSKLFRKGGQFSARREKSYSKLQMVKDDDSDSVKVKKLENNLLSDNVKTEKEMEESIPATPSAKDKKSPSLFKGMKNEKVCQICEKAGDVVRCKGPCLGVFHINCLTKHQLNLKSKLLISNSDLKAISPLAGDNSCADVTEDENNYAIVTNHKSNVQISDKDACEDKTEPKFSDMNETFHKIRQENNLSESAIVSNKNLNVKTKHSIGNNIKNTIDKTVKLPSKTVSSGVISNDNIPENTSSNDETRSVCSKNTNMKNKWSVKNSLVMGESGDNSEDSENEPFPGFELQDLSPKMGKNALLKYDGILPTKASSPALSETKRGKATEEDSASVRLSSASLLNKDRSRCTPTKHVELANDDSDTKGGKAKRDKKKKEDESEEEKVGADFLCPGCSQNLMPPCFVCGQELHPITKEDMRQRCAIVQCGKFYHLSCANEWPQTWFSKTGSSRLSTKQPAMTCPQHTCHTCASDDPRNINMRFTNEKLVRCIYCPTTYHYGNHCIPAGSEILNTTQLVCPKHYKPKRKGIHHVNVSWCSICTEGGSLMCCDICPNSFHAHCLVMPVPEGGYTCEDCQTGRFPLYGEVVWVKLGAYRWWPAQIMFPHEIPENIRNLPHVRGEFAVKFFGSHDHYWVNRGRVFIYQVGGSLRETEHWVIGYLCWRATIMPKPQPILTLKAHRNGEATLTQLLSQVMVCELTTYEPHLARETYLTGPIIYK